MAGRKLTKQQKRRLDRTRSTGVEDASTAGWELGRVISHRGQRVLLLDEHGHEVQAFQRSNLSLVTGDRVSWLRAPDQHTDNSLGHTNTASKQGGQPGGRNKGHVVTALHPRSTFLSRPDPYGKVKPVVANIEQMCVVIAPEPEPHRNLVDRYLIAARASGLKVLVVLNKCEIDHSEARQMLADYAALGYPTLAVSATDAINIDQLIECCSQTTSILVGQSGVGKSSLINALLPKAEAEIGRLSEAQTKGRHTTSRSTLYPLANAGWLVDSPGIREFGLSHFSVSEVEQGFVEFDRLIGQCRFRNCTHMEHEAGCAIQAASEKGEISAERLLSFRRIINELPSE